VKNLEAPYLRENIEILNCVVAASSLPHSYFDKYTISVHFRIEWDISINSSEGKVLVAGDDISRNYPPICGKSGETDFLVISKA
jgi:hypothetical protein